MKPSAARGGLHRTRGGRVVHSRACTVQSPLPKVKWSIRNNINLQQSAVLLALNYFANNGRVFLENFYLKSKRSVAKAPAKARGLGDSGR